MSTHLTGALFALLGGFVVAASQAFTPSPLGWVAFGIALVVAAVALLAQLDPSRGVVRRALDAATVIVAALLIIFSLTSAGSAVARLSFAFTVGIVVLTVHGDSGRRSHSEAQPT